MNKQISRSGVTYLNTTQAFETLLLQTIPAGPHRDEFTDKENGGRPLRDLRLKVEWNKLDGITPSHWNGYVQPEDVEFVYHFYHGNEEENRQYGFTEHAGRILARKEEQGLRCIAYKSGTIIETQRLEDMVNQTAKTRAEIITSYILRNMQKKR